MRILILVLLYFLTACSKSESVDSIEPEMMTSSATTTDFSKQKLLSEAKFNNGAHPTSGIAKIYVDGDGKKTLVFENFKTDAGPDLRIYIAKDKALSGFVELSTKVENGNKSYAIPTTVDVSQQNFVLIWCKQFAVLFGHAELK